MTKGLLDGLDLAGMTREVVNQEKNRVEKKLPSGGTESWESFLNYMEEYSQNSGVKGPGREVFIDSDIKDAIDKIKREALGYPVKHIVNAMLRVFIEEHRQNITSAIETNKSGEKLI